MQEALEKWPIKLMEKLLPRHIQIAYDINLKWILFVQKTKPDVKISEVSLVEEGEVKRLRMGHMVALILERCRLARCQRSRQNPLGTRQNRPVPGVCQG